MFTKYVVVAILVLMLSINGFTYTGTLSTPDGIVGEENWFPISLTWNVTQNPNSSWRYEYNFVVSNKDISHIIIETSDNFTDEDILEGSLTVIEGSIGEYYIGEHEPDSGNPEIPNAIYGIKFNEVYGLNVHFSFDSWRVPVWGDFYAKNGKTNDKDNVAWNASFGLPDPQDPASDGSIDYKILRPNAVVPEPSSLMAFGVMLTGAAGLIRRRKK